MLWNIWLCMVIVGVLLFIISIVLMFVFKIPELLDELSGRKAKRQVKRLKELNLGTGSLEGMGTDDIYAVVSDAEMAIDNPIKIDLEETTYVDSTGEDIVGDSDSTNYMSEDSMETSYVEDNSTSFMQDDDATAMLSDIKEFSSKRHLVEVLEEQSSL